ncbi:MAG: TlpA family protein disulfide reductase [Acidimicrobiales bacterium]
MASPLPKRHFSARHLVIGGLAGVVVAVAALAVLAGRSPSGPPLPAEGPAVGSAAPSFTLSNLANPGSQVKLGNPDGRPTVLTFFGSWCPNCHKDVGVLSKASRQFGNSVNFVGVDVADTRSAGLSLVRSAGIDYPVAFDPQRQVSGSLYRLVGMPSTVFVNSKGKLIHTVLGAITAVELTNWVSRSEA